MKPLQLGALGLVDCLRCLLYKRLEFGFREDGEDFADTDTHAGFTVDESCRSCGRVMCFLSVLQIVVILFDKHHLSCSSQSGCAFDPATGMRGSPQTLQIGRASCRERV